MKLLIILIVKKEIYIRVKKSDDCEIEVGMI